MGFLGFSGHRRFRRVSARALYLLSPFAVALVACSVVGILLYMSAISALERQERAQVQEKVGALAENIGRQHESMRAAAAQIGVNPLYRRGGLRPGAFNDIKLLKDFARYGGNSPIAPAPVLIYGGEERVYRSSGSASSFAFYVAAAAFGEDERWLREALQPKGAFAAIPVTAGGESAAIFAYPVFTKGRGDPSGHATLAFLVSPAALRGQIRTLVGELDGRVDIYWNGSRLMTPQDSLGGADAGAAERQGGGGNDGGAAQLQAEPLSAELNYVAQPLPGEYAKYAQYAADSPGGGFRVVYTAPPGHPLGNGGGAGGDRFRFVNIAYLAVVVLFVLALAAAVGYRAYRPIRQLAQSCEKAKAGATDGAGGGGGVIAGTETGTGTGIGTMAGARAEAKPGGGRDFGEVGEVESVALFLDSLLTEKQHAEDDLRRQYALIKKQILKLLLAGDRLYLKLVREPFMGICLPGPWYMAAAVEAAPLPDAEAGELAACVEGLSDGELRLYFVEASVPGRFAILASLPSEDMAGEALDNARALLAEIVSCRVGASQPFADIEKMSEAFSQALAKCASAGVGADRRAGELFWYDAAMADGIVSAIEAMDCKAAMEGFEAFMDAAAHGSRHVSYERYSCMRLLEAIESGAGAGNDGRQGAALDYALMDRIAASRDRLEMRQSFTTLLFRLCGAEAADVEAQPGCAGGGSAEPGGHGGKARVRTEKFLAYISENYMDKDMSLEKFAEHFGYSNRFVSRIIKNETGRSYKDYLIELRIQKARELLSEDGITVTEVCDQVGFAYLPHFIQTFRRITGFTPGKYAESALEQAQAAAGQ
ncbi:MAG: helix-turn-helix transcriptional regulator [Clostridiales bacterium]|jgi:AraC-like DNA-binding protein|nr:helix-turn-helix transcriptional regulator [Clostridiales bacterium]